MLVHSVFFSLNDNLTAQERQAFLAGVESLRGCRTVKAMYVGAPAKTPVRAVIDTAYDVALTVIFDNLAAHDVYQTDPIHLAFVEKFRSMWTQVRIFDAE